MNIVEKDFDVYEIKKKKNRCLCILTILLTVSVLTNVYLVSKLDIHNAQIDALTEQKSILQSQINARNEVIDSELGLNLNTPTNLSDNYMDIMSNKRGFVAVTEDDKKKIEIPLYTPDGHYFGIISYSAYSAIQNDTLENYECLNNKEAENLHSYLNYITLKPGMSLIQID